jgi:hypothetical protein
MNDFGFSINDPGDSNFDLARSILETWRGIDMGWRKLDRVLAKHVLAGKTLRVLIVERDLS